MYLDLRIFKHLYLQMRPKYWEIISLSAGTVHCKKKYCKIYSNLLAILVARKTVYLQKYCKSIITVVLTFVASGLDMNGCVLSYFEGTSNLHCYTSCTLTTLHCSKVSFLQCCHMKRYNKIFTKMWGVYSLLWDTIYIYIYILYIYML